MDRGAEWLSGTDLPGAFLVSTIWWCWFQPKESTAQRDIRAHLICTLLGGLAGIIVARCLGLLFPFRVRPRFDPSVGFIPPGADAGYFIDWSSFPSNHMVLFAALAIGVSVVSWRLAASLLAFILLFIGLPRIYVGLHYTSDVLVGTLIGSAIGLLANRRLICDSVGERAMYLHDAYPGPFYTVYWLVTFEAGTVFGGLRSALAAAAHVLKSLGS